MANKIIDKNKINKESKRYQTAQDKGVGSTDWLYFVFDQSNKSTGRDFTCSNPFAINPSHSS